MAKELYKKRMIGLNVIRKKVKELDKRMSGMDDPIKKSKLSKQRDKAIGRIDSRLKMKNFGFGTKAGVTKKRNEFLKTGKMPKTVSGSIVGFTKKLGGIKGMSAGGNADIDLLMKGDRSDVATGRTKKNLRSELDEKIKKLREKFKGRGTSGDAEFRKQKGALEEKFDKKYFSDMKMATKYGKDAYKSQAFGTSPDAPKRKKKPVPLNVKLMKEKGFTKKTADLIKESDDYVKSVNFKVARSKLARKNKAKAEAEKKKKKKITKTKAMRGGGLVRSGSGSLSGYKVR